MFIYYPDLKVDVEKYLIGNKAKNLEIMQNAGYIIPKWFVLTTKAIQNTLGDNINIDEISEIIENISLTEELLKEINRTIQDLNLTNKLLAVRSSAVEEDGKNYSFAGQFESFLYVKEEDLITRIKDVWKSAYNNRTRFYKNHNHLNSGFTGIAVIVQEMIDSDVSGVAFGIDPITGKKDIITISSVYGTGEGIVSGELNADTFYVQGNQIKTIPAHKTHKVTINAHTRKDTAKIALLEKEKQNITLCDEQVLEVAHQVQSLNDLFNTPQDVEWCLADTQLYILQSRPVTGLKNNSDKSGIKVIWDNSNIIESYPGITTPLTFSFIKDVYTEVYKQFCRIMGVEEELIQKNNNIFQMIGLINGRVYYNLLNWYKVLSLLPGYSLNAGFMEQMMGVKEKLEIPPEVLKSNKNEYSRVLKLIMLLLINLFKLPNDIDKFYLLLNKTLKPFENIDLSNKNPEELVSIYYYLERELLKNWYAPLVNDFFSMIFYGLLKKLLIKWDIDQNGTLQNDLLIYDGDIISSEPIRKIRAMSNQICQNKQLENLFLNNPEDIILEKLPEYSINIDFQDYINKFGIRCMEELKLETVTYKENPGLLISLVKTYVRQGYVKQDKNNSENIKLRKKAEDKAITILKNRPFESILFKYILKQTRLRVKHRENLRFERTRLFAVIRNIFLAIGANFHKEDIIEYQRDIFYLTKEEIFNYINGTATTTNLKAMIDLRKIEYRNDEDRSMDNRFITYGTVYNNEFLLTNISKEETVKNLLTGTGCCRGKIKAPIRIVNNPAEVINLEGCILVTEKTDPGWVPLFAISKGLLVERGSILSHSAIVAREMGLPAIVGVNNLVNRLIDGEIVEMDGSKGTIKLFRGEHE